MRARILLLLTALTTAAALAGCGGSSGASINPALGSELTYFPAGTAFVLSLTTDPNSNAIKSAQQLEGQFPLAAAGQTTLKQKLAQLGINYGQDIRPLFGNPLALGSATATFSGSARSQFLLVWVTKDAGKLQALLKKVGSGLQPSGSRDGATLYSSGSSAAAISGATLVLGDNLSTVDAALDRHAHGGGVTAAEFERETSGLPANTLAEAFGNLTGALSQPRAATARKVPWVSALRGYGVAIEANPSSLTLRFHLDTSGASLATDQLPLASGAATPSYAGSAPINVGIHDPAQIFDFIQSSEQSSNPAGYARFLSRQAKVRAKTGVDLTSFSKLLTGDLVVGSDSHLTLARVQVSDSATASQDLAKLVSTPNGLFSQGERITKLPGGIYAIHERRRTINVGVVGNQLVAGNAPPSQLQAFAATPATPASGSEGTVAFQVNLAQLIRQRLKKAPPAYVQSLLSQLGELTGWGSSSPSGTDGSATLSVR